MFSTLYGGAPTRTRRPGGGSVAGIRGRGRGGAWPGRGRWASEAR